MVKELLYCGQVDSEDLSVAKLHGYGTLYEKRQGNKCFEGHFTKGLPEGFGKLYMKNKPIEKLKYCGGFKHGSKNGMGRNYLSSGELSFVGFWRNNKPRYNFIKYKNGCIIAYNLTQSLKKN